MESIVEAFERHVRDQGERQALWSRGEDLKQSFAQLNASALEWQSRLPVAGRRPIAVAVGNVGAFCHLSLAMLRLGIPMVTMDASAPHARKRELCRHLGIATLLHRDGAQATDLQVSFPGDVRAARLAVQAAAELPAPTAVVKLTSGSTGRPEGICLSAEGLAHGIRQIGDGMELSTGERILIAIPLSHSYGFDNGVLSLLALGTPLILEPGIFPSSLLKALAESEATFMPLVPPLVRSLGQSQWPDGLALRRVICAGGLLQEEQAQRFFESSGRAVHNFYGSTETGGICFEASPQEAAARGTVGKPLPGVRVVIDSAGRVNVTSPANLLGYLGRPPLKEQGTDDAPPVAASPATACAMAGTTVITGDTGVWTADGRLRLTGRTADILNIGGRKIPAVRVETALRELPGVCDVAVVGVDDAVRGDRTVAFVVSDRWPLDTTSLPATLLPREMRRLETLPYNERGKVVRQRLRQLATQGRGDEGASPWPPRS